MNRTVMVVVAAAVAIAGAVALGMWRWNAGEPDRIRRALFAEVVPVALANCEVERFGDSHDGGYLSCANLLKRATSVYSYGINAQDEWGCDVSHLLKVPVHQYDCFNPVRPDCAVGAPVFHEECVGPARVTESGRLFDTMQAQIARNGDDGKKLIMKMDVEGSEWPSLLGAPDSVLEQIDQLSVEFHGLDKPQPEYLEVMRRLKQLFYVVHVHDNNFVCDPTVAPFSASVFEVLFVNKKLGVLDTSGQTVPAIHPLDSPNSRGLPDCQAGR